MNQTRLIKVKLHRYKISKTSSSERRAVMSMHRETLLYLKDIKFMYSLNLPLVVEVVALVIKACQCHLLFLFPRFSFI